MKFCCLMASCVPALASLPVRGAWIEMRHFAAFCGTMRGRSPCGERGLKLCPSARIKRIDQVAPRAGSVD